MREILESIWNAPKEDVVSFFVGVGIFYLLIQISALVYFKYKD